MTCKDCVHYEACGGFTPTDLDQDVFDYCIKGTTDEIPDIDERCGSFKNKADFVEVKRGFWLVNRSSAEARFICSECGFMHIEADPEANIEYNGCPMCLARLDKRKEGADNG